MPSSAPPPVNPPKLEEVQTTARLVAWIHIPDAINHLRPTRSDHAPVANCTRPHVAGYTAARMPICSSVICEAANTDGNSPHAMPSLRLLTSPAWLTADRLRSLRLVRQNTSRGLGVGPTEAACFASRATCALVSRTRSTDSRRPRATKPTPR